MTTHRPASQPRPGYGLALLGACTLPAALYAELPGSQALGLAGLGALGLASRWRYATICAAALIGYVASSAAPPFAMALLTGLGLLVLVHPIRRHRVHRVVVGAGIGLSLLIVGVTLGASGRDGEGLLIRLGGGLVMGALAATAAEASCRAGARWRRGAAVVSALAALILAAPPWQSAPTLPGHRIALAALTSLSSPADLARDPAALAALERLRVGGHGAAAHLWVAMAVLQNATPDRIRSACPRSVDGDLGGGWRPWVEQGRLICRSLNGLPEQGAALLAGTPAPHLIRLRGDLLLEAGRLAEGVATARAAATAGDPFARRNAVRALVDRNRLAEAYGVADPADALTTLWVEPERDGPALWAAWNAALDLTTLGSPERLGLQPMDAPGRLLSLIDPERRHRVLVTHTRYGTRFGVTLPLPPGRRIPGVITLTVRNRRGLEVVLGTDDGARLTYSCAPFRPAPQETVLSLPGAACAGTWATVAVTPGTVLSGTLTAFLMRGDFALAALEIQP